jgi:hypothetical protein
MGPKVQKPCKCITNHSIPFHGGCVCVRVCVCVGWSRRTHHVHSIDGCRVVVVVVVSSIRTDRFMLHACVEEGGQEGHSNNTMYRTTFG